MHRPLTREQKLKQAFLTYNDFDSLCDAYIEYRWGKREVLDITSVTIEDVHGVNLKRSDKEEIAALFDHAKGLTLLDKFIDIARTSRHLTALHLLQEVKAEKRSSRPTAAARPRSISPSPALFGSPPAVSKHRAVTPDREKFLDFLSQNLEESTAVGKTSEEIERNVAAIKRKFSHNLYPGFEPFSLLCGRNLDRIKPPPVSSDLSFCLSLIIASFGPMSPEKKHQIINWMADCYSNELIGEAVVANTTRLLKRSTAHLSEIKRSILYPRLNPTDEIQVSNLKKFGLGQIERYQDKEPLLSREELTSPLASPFDAAAFTHEGVKAIIASPPPAATTFPSRPLPDDFRVDPVNFDGLNDTFDISQDPEDRPDLASGAASIAATSVGAASSRRMGRPNTTPSAASSVTAASRGRTKYTTPHFPRSDSSDLTKGRIFRRTPSATNLFAATASAIPGGFAKTGYAPSRVESHNGYTYVMPPASEEYCSLIYQSVIDLAAGAMHDDRVRTAKWKSDCFSDPIKMLKAGGRICTLLGISSSEELRMIRPLFLKSLDQLNSRVRTEGSHSRTGEAIEEMQKRINQLRRFVSSELMPYSELRGPRAESVGATTRRGAWR